MPSSPQDAVDPAVGRPGEAPGRSWHRLLLDRSFGRYMAGNVLTMLGIWTYNVVAVVVAFDVTGSALVAGAVTAAQFIPQIVVAPLAGMAADRWDRRRQALTGHLIAAAGSGGLALWAWRTDMADDAATALLIASAVVGIGNSIAGPAIQALIPALVRRSELHTAVTLGMTPLPLGRALGPILGTTIAAMAEPAAAFALTSSTSVAFAVLVIGMRPRRVRPETAQEPGTTSACRYLVQHRPVILLLLCVAAIGAGTDPAITLAPVISAELGAGSGMAGPIATTFGVGAGVGFALVPVARRRLGTRYGYTGLAVMAAGTALPAVAPVTAVVLTGFALAGAGLTLAMTGLGAALQATLPDEVRGRVMALWGVAFAGTRPLAALVNGALADRYGYAAALALGAVLLVAVGWLGWTRGEGSRDPRGSVSGRGEQRDDG